MSNGEVQFFSIEDDDPDRSSETPIPSLDKDRENRDKNIKKLLIVAVGINYSQGPIVTAPLPLPNHHLFRINKGRSWVVDNGSPATRKALDEALRQFDANAPTWLKNGYASHINFPTQLCSGGQPNPYILVCTNVSPLLSQKPWGNHSTAEQQAALDPAVWKPNDHLCDLIDKLGKYVDLWVVHGKDHVWATFDKSTCWIDRWLMTPNLSALGRISMGTFWTRSLKITPRPPIWPHCCATSKADLLDLPTCDE